jgi:hypothetical protein
MMRPQTAFIQRSAAQREGQAGEKMPTNVFTLRSSLVVATIATGIACAVAEEPLERIEHAAPKRQCLSTSQSRQTIEENSLVDPFVCMRAAAREHQGEALGARLCRHDESFIYEISLLQPDGRIVKIPFDARTGKPHSGHRDR